MTSTLTPTRPGRATALAWRFGTTVSTLAGLRDGSGPAGLGRVACFAVRRGARCWSEPLLLTGRHVLTAHGAAAGDPVYAPHLADDGEMLEIDPGSLDPVAEVTGEGIDGTVLVSEPGSHEAPHHLDAGVARLLDERLEPSGAAAFTVGRVHPHDALPHRRLAVRLLGVPGTTGDVVATDAVVERADGVLCPGTIVVRTRQGRPPFAAEGDSGALVADARGRAIGMLWGVDLTDPTLAYACHLRPVLDWLDLVPSLRAGLTTLAEES